MHFALSSLEESEGNSMIFLALAGDFLFSGTSIGAREESAEIVAGKSAAALSRGFRTH